MPADHELDGRVDVDVDGGRATTPSTRTRRARMPRSAGQWSRSLHVYTSMISLLVVLFFGVTGLTLNHPSWTFGDEAVRSSSTGTLPDGAIVGDTIDFLAIAEHVRSTYDVTAPVGDYSASATTGTLSFKGPGYVADLVFDVTTGEYTLTIEEQGFVAVLNDLHKGRDTSSAWKWVIDISAGFLVAVALTGLAIQLLTRKRRRSAVIVTVAFGVLSIVLMFSTLA